MYSKVYSGNKVDGEAVGAMLAAISFALSPAGRARRGTKWEYQSPRTFATSEEIQARRDERRAAREGNPKKAKAAKAKKGRRS